MLAPPRDVAAVDVTAADPGPDDKPDSTRNSVAAEPQPVDAAGLVAFEAPPPSNMLLVLAGLGFVGTVPDIVIPGQVVVLSIGPSGAGLNPPAESSLEPSGMPEPSMGDVRSIVPSGDVVPAPGAGGGGAKITHLRSTWPRPAQRQPCGDGKHPCHGNLRTLQPAASAARHGHPRRTCGVRPQYREIESASLVRNCCSPGELVAT
jgi:hypothetical protein